MANNNYPQITSVTSEALQAQIRNLLPSQEGFGTDLMAQNVIVPIIDLTSAAEGSTVPENLQTAYGLVNGSVYHSAASTVTAINNTGFWQIDVISTLNASFSGQSTVTITDGTTTATIFYFSRAAGSSQNNFIVTNQRMTIFLAAGQSLQLTNSTTSHNLFVTYRQIADVNGNLVNPLGFNPQ